MRRLGSEDCRRAFWSVFLVLGSVALLACDEGTNVVAADESENSEWGNCRTREDCEAYGESFRGLVCGANFTCERCTTGSQCGLREKCDEESGRCVFKEGFSDECMKNDDCAGGSFCVQGTCVPALEVAFCVQGTCLASGQRCNGVNGVCELDLGCLTNSDCAPGTEVCNVPTRTCVPACTSETWREVCAVGQVCASDRCSDCAQDSHCATGLICDLERLACTASSGWNKCARDEDCPKGETCAPDLKVCFPARPTCTSDESCGQGFMCTIASGKCVEKSCEPDRFEPNEDRAAVLESERDLAVGTFSELTLCNGDVDFYPITLSRGDALSVQFVGDVLLSGRVQLKILDRLGRSLGAGSLSALGVAVEDGRHVIEVRSEEKWGNYGLTIAISKATPCDFDAFEPNDIPEQASSLTEGNIWRGLTICQGDVDYFSLSVPEGFFPVLTADVAPGMAAVDVEEILDFEASGDATRSRLFRVFSPLVRASSTYDLSLRFEKDLEALHDD